MTRKLRYHLSHLWKLPDFTADHAGWVLGICAAVFLVLGWGQDGINLDSATYAVVARNMVDLNLWFNPQYTPYYLTAFAEHPPLVMWMQAIIFYLTGANDSTARLFGALCTLGSVLMVYRIGQHAFDRSYAFLAGLILLLTYNFMQIGNSTLLDVPMAFFVLLVLYGVTKMQKEGVSTHSAVITGLGLGGAWLTKGVVSAPVWAALAITCIVWNRHWLRSSRFWLLPLIALGLAATHLALDQIYADGHFFQRYFYHQVLGRSVGSAAGMSAKWWEFTYRFVSLYLPFVILFLPGTYLVIKQKQRLLYPVMFTLLFYFLSYSIASKLYYHYFGPVYALAALPAALALHQIVKERFVRRLAVVFLFLWLTTAVAVAASGIRIHHIRSSNIYALNDQMRELIGDHATGEGLVIGTGIPDWDYIAKTAWYWRSSIDQVATVEEALSELHSGRFVYLLIDNRQVEYETLKTQYGGEVRIAAHNEGVSIFVSRVVRSTDIDN